MAYDTELADRVRDLVGLEYGISEKAMFGGLAFLVNGNMAVAVSGAGGLMLRVPPDETDDIVALEHVSPMVMAGRETRGWVRVAAAAVADDAGLVSWVERGLEHARTLPPKQPDRSQA